MTWHERLRELATERKLTMAELSRLSGVPYDSVNKYMRGEIEKPRGNTLEKLAAALKTSRLFLQEGLGEPKPLAGQPVPYRGEVAAGVWLEAGDLSLESEKFLPYNPAPEFPEGSVFCLTVRGDSIDQTAPDGASLICVDLMLGGIDIRDGDLAIVQRTREQGGLVEVTAKRVRKVPGGYELVPESNNPRWKSLFLDPNIRPDDDGEFVQVVARVEYVLLKP